MTAPNSDAGNRSCKLLGRGAMSRSLEPRLLDQERV